MSTYLGAGGWGIDQSMRSQVVVRPVTRRNEGLGSGSPMLLELTRSVRKKTYSYCGLDLAGSGWTRVA